MGTAAPGERVWEPTTRNRNKPANRTHICTHIYIYIYMYRADPLVFITPIHNLTSCLHSFSQNYTKQNSYITRHLCFCFNGSYESSANSPAFYKTIRVPQVGVRIWDMQFTNLSRRDKFANSIFLRAAIQTRKFGIKIWAGGPDFDSKFPAPRT